MADTRENSLLLLVFNNVPASLYVSLHTADPGAAGDQTTNEIRYRGYARVAVPRTSADWAVMGNSVMPVARISFPISKGGRGGSVTHFGIGTAPSGAGALLYSGAFAVPQGVGKGSVPEVGWGWPSPNPP